ncbi:MAG: hypothetical protein K2O43_06910, partial [Muribaculaceae bacterium]|nr:hypothetical protein [Muribaculaceae bacterium]
LLYGNYNRKFDTEDASEIEIVKKIALENEVLRPLVYKITPGNNPGEYTIAKLTNLEIDKDFNPIGEESFTYDLCIYYFRLLYNLTYNDNIYVTITANTGMSWGSSFLTRYNIKDNQWQVIKKLDSNIENYNIKYQDKLWYFDEYNMENLGIHWLDINKEEAGFIKSNVTLPDFVKYEGYTNGIITYSGADPATSNKVNIYIDITTGEAVNEVNTPEMIFNTIIPLN